MPPLPTPPIILSNEITYRNDFAGLCNRNGCLHAIEVGTDLAVFACEFLSVWSGHLLICVDPYAPYGEMPYCRDGDFAMALLALARFPGRVKLMREPSPAAAQLLPTWLKNFGFVYLDAEHTYPAVSADLRAWWDVLAPGAILAGHDYCAMHAGVIRAVNEFAAERELAVNLTRESDFPSWYLYKP